MDKKGNDFDNVENGSKNNPLVSVNNPENVKLNGGTGEGNDAVPLLLPRRGGLSKKLAKPRLKVQWNDKDGNKLAEVLEFQPSDVSDSDDDDSDACICAIM